MRTLVTGATGFVGRHLLAHLPQPVALSRSRRPGSDDTPLTTFVWDPVEGPPPPQSFDGVDTVIHLAGESIADGRWTAAKKQRIEASRVLGTQHLVQGLVAAPRPPRVLVCASAVGYYGSRGDQELDEQAGPGDDFLARVCVQWEAATGPAVEAGIRVVQLRIGVVLGAGGGALAAMAGPFRWGLGGRLGSGRQWMAWISLEDLVQLILFACHNEHLQGPVNATAPAACTNAQFTRALGRTLHRPTLLPVPAPLLRLALGEFANVLLASQRAVPTAALGAGFQFQYPQIDDALDHALRAATR